MPEARTQMLAQTPTLDGRRLRVQRDPLDIRDRLYVPRLFNYELQIAPPELEFPVRDQVLDGPCTGYALAAVIDMQNQDRRARMLQAKAGAGSSAAAAAAVIPKCCSARMLYEVAKSHDEFLFTRTGGKIVEGSSVRGALKGFYHSGVAPDDPVEDDPFRPDWQISIARSKAARNVMLGSYFRIEPVLNHYHSAIAEVGAILVSARIHPGWTNPVDENGRPGVIQWSADEAVAGGHAFAIIGYDHLGFLVLNSWGPRWGGFDGHPGVAHWSYADWAANVMDAWVLRLGVPTPQAFDFSIGEHGLWRTREQVLRPGSIASLPRSNVIGHYANIDDGVFVADGSYPSDIGSIQTTADHLAANANGKYQGLVLYAHGGLNNIKNSIGRAGAMKDGFKRNGMYPFFFCWNTGVVGEASDILNRIFEEAIGRTGAARDDIFDRVLERLARVPGRAFWREMKRGALAAFRLRSSAGMEAVSTFHKALAAPGASDLPIHLIGHSAGAIFLGEMVRRMRDEERRRIASVTLFAPACTTGFFNKHWLPLASELKASAGGKDRFALYNLGDGLELADTVGPYRKSLLYFVSNAFEEGSQTGAHMSAPLAGMDHFGSLLGDDPSAYPGQLPFDVHLSDPVSAVTRSLSHGGFDADPITMNHVLTRLTGKPLGALKPFRPEEIAGL